MAYVRKTRDEWDIQQYTGPQYGWESVCSEGTWKEARETLRLYRTEQPEYPVRAVKRRYALGDVR
jgi:hypothetical protein